jgi:ATP-dependent exoDNAse (exonuclease V) beta subunit
VFTYPELETEQHQGMRFYHTASGPYPSITTILGGSQSEEAQKALEGWRQSLGATKAAEVSKKATDRGTNVHLLAERYLKKQDPYMPINGAPIPDPDKAAFNALKLKLDKIDEVWGQEVPLYSDFYQVAGRCDLVGKFKGVPVIVDFKTAGRVKSRKDIGDYELQLIFYGDSHNEMFGTNIQEGVILMVADTGFPMEFHVPFTDELRLRLAARIDEFNARLAKKYA